MEENALHGSDLYDCNSRLIYEAASVIGQAVLPRHVPNSLIQS
jgi:hypothetical protein